MRRSGLFQVELQNKAFRVSPQNVSNAKTCAWHSPSIPCLDDPAWRDLSSVPLNPAGRFGSAAGQLNGAPNGWRHFSFKPTSSKRDLLFARRATWNALRPPICPTTGSVPPFRPRGHCHCHCHLSLDSQLFRSPVRNLVRRYIHRPVSHSSFYHANTTIQAPSTIVGETRTRHLHQISAFAIDRPGAVPDSPYTP